jgi:hypothetical protein
LPQGHLFLFQLHFEQRLGHRVRADRERLGTNSVNGRQRCYYI